MKAETLYELPFPSTALDGQVRLLHAGLDVWLLYQYINIDYGDKLYNSGMIFRAAHDFKFTSESYVLDLDNGVYDHIIKLAGSDWENYLQQAYHAREWFDPLFHYAIFFDSNGLYEFYASGFDVLPIKEGEIDLVSYPIYSLITEG